MARMVGFVAGRDAGFVYRDQMSGFQGLFFDTGGMTGSL
jgi:hypothetical protein